MDNQPVLVIVTFDGGSSNHILMQMAAVIDFVSHTTDGKPSHRRKLVRRELPGTSAKAEIYSLYMALHSLAETTIEHCASHKIPMYLILRGDSEYALKGATEWSQKWRRQNLKGRKHPEVWRSIYALMDFFSKIGTVKVGSQSSDYDTGPELKTHNFCHDVCQELRAVNGKEELCTLTIDNAPPFEFNEKSIKWFDR